MADPPLADPLAWRQVKAPSLDELEVLAQEAYRRLPHKFRSLCEGLVIRVEDFADDETLAEMEIESPFELAGLYRGAPLTARGAADLTQHLDMVFLYRRALLDWWSEDTMDFEDLVRHVLIHEIGHHFGFSDDDMERIEAEAAQE